MPAGLVYEKKQPFLVQLDAERVLTAPTPTMAAADTMKERMPTTT